MGKYDYFARPDEPFDFEEDALREERRRRDYAHLRPVPAPRTDCTDCGGFGASACTWPLCPTGDVEISR